MSNTFNFPYIYHMFNTYNAQEKWVYEDEKRELEQDDNWECVDKFKQYPEDWQD